MDRQLESAYYQRVILSTNSTLSTNITKTHPNTFLDTYVLEFLNLPSGYTENDLQNALLENMKDFLLEIGRDFTYMGKEIKIQVGTPPVFATSISINSISIFISENDYVPQYDYLQDQDLVLF